MSEPITIGDQTFINDPDRGWIDRKTKQPADKSLTKLLESLELKPVEKKLRVKIDRKVEPVTINGQKFVYDSNASAWIDEKTKVKAAESLQKTLNSVVKVTALAETSEEVEKAFGTIGQMAKAKVNVKTPKLPKKGKAKPSKLTASTKQPAKKATPSQLINPIIVNMVSVLSSIDDTLKQQLEQKKQLDRQNAEQADEDRLENKNALDDVIKKEEHATRVKASNALLVGGGALLLMQYFDPIMELVTNVGEVVYDMAKYTFDAMGKINDWLGWFNDNSAPETPPEGNEEATPPGAPPPPPKPEQTQAKPSEALKKKYRQEAEKEWTKRRPKLDQKIKEAVKREKKWGGKYFGLTDKQAKEKETEVQKKAFIDSYVKDKIKSTTAERVAPTAGPAAAPDAAPSSSNGLNADLNKALEAANAEYRQATGKDLKITSKRRSLAEQKSLWNMSVRQGHPGVIDWPSGRRTKVAFPGQSNHQTGNAVDIIPDATAIKILAKHGLYRTNPEGDPVHFELKRSGAPAPESTGVTPQAATPEQVQPTVAEQIVDTAKATATDALNPQLEFSQNIASKNTVASADTIRKSAIEKTADEVEARQPYVPPPPPPPMMPNLNAGKPNYGIKTPPAPEDKKILMNYLVYMNLLPVQTTSELTL